MSVSERPYRDLAADWHGGQWSPMYAYASTGNIVDGLVAEIDECIREAVKLDPAYNAHDLRMFRVFVSNLVDPMDFDS